MTREEFASYGIRHFTPDEVMATGAQLADVRPRLIQHLDRFRAAIGRDVTLIKNGLTTGAHTSQEHKDGLAADITYKNIEPAEALKAAMLSDFCGFGVYYHYGKWVSVHLDLRSDYAFWIGVKTGNQKLWRYESLISEPT